MVDIGRICGCDRDCDCHIGSGEDVKLADFYHLRNEIGNIFSPLMKV